MIKYMAFEEQEEFWRRHRESKEQIQRDFDKLPRKKKLKIIKEMEANRKAMRNAEPLVKD